MGDTFLFVALTRAGWGETALGIQVANDLLVAGDKPIFLAHDSNALLLSQTSFEREFVSDHSSSLVELYMDTVVNTHHPRALVLCDLLTTQRFFLQVGVDGGFLRKYGLPILAIDTWDHRVTGTSIDLFGSDQIEVDVRLGEFARSLIPVPLVRPAAKEGAYACLPAPIRVSRKVRTHIRENLGLSDSDRVILFCTAAWQQMQYRNRDGERFAAMLPLLLGEYIERLGSDVHLVHVGPAAYPIGARLGDRYHWLPPLPTLHFDELLGSVELLLSANISAGTMFKAVASGIPALFVRNTREARSLRDLEQWLEGPSDSLLRWLAEAVPIYPYNLWPLGWASYLQPILEDNSYIGSMETVEMLDERGFAEVCDGLLRDRSVRAALFDRQAALVRDVNRLPRPSQVVRSYLGA